MLKICKNIYVLFTIFISFGAANANILDADKISRAGEFIWLNNNTAHRHRDQGVWANANYTNLKYKDIKSNMYNIYMGYDFKAAEFNNSTIFTGMSMKYGVGKNKLKAEPTFLPSMEVESDVTSLSLGGYVVWVHNDGFYLETKLNLNNVREDITVDLKPNFLNFDSSRVGFDIGVEAGKEFTLDPKNIYFLTPFVKFQHSYLSGDNLNDFNNFAFAEMNASKISSIGGGAKFDTRFLKQESNELRGYLRAAAFYENGEFISRYKLALSGYEKDKFMTYEIGTGLAYKISYLYLHADLGYATGEYKEIKASLGIRYEFGDMSQQSKIVNLQTLSISGFVTNGYKLTPEFKEQINNENIKLNDGEKIYITGHTDNIGTHEYNQALSEKRAKSVADEFKDIKKESKSVSGKSFDEPVDTNETEAGRTKNRRVEIEIK